jgi:hypothetical protein
LTASPGLPCWLLAVQDWVPELPCAMQIRGMPKAAANEIKTDDFTNRPNVIRCNFPLPYSTIYLGFLPQSRSMHYERAPRFRRWKLDVAPPPLRCAVQGLRYLRPDATSFLMRLINS